jgi:hypothetical protein
VRLDDASNDCLRFGPLVFQITTFLPDGEHVVDVISSGCGPGLDSQLNVVLNWFDEVRRKVPAE